MLEDRCPISTRTHPFGGNRHECIGGGQAQEDQGGSGSS